MHKVRVAHEHYFSDLKKLWDEVTHVTESEHLIVKNSDEVFLKNGNKFIGFIGNKCTERGNPYLYSVFGMYYYEKAIYLAVNGQPDKEFGPLLQNVTEEYIILETPIMCLELLDELYEKFQKVQFPFEPCFMTPSAYEKYKYS